MIDFFGWNMPLNYGSVIAEHQAVRSSCGIFDVSHMHILDILGEDDSLFVERCFACSIPDINQAKYGVMLNEQGGIIDDLMLYKLADRFRVILNAATKDNDMQHLLKQAEYFSVELVTCADLGIIAVQGPKYLEVLAKDIAEKASSIAPMMCHVDSMMISKTGYTGEDGVELIAQHAQLDLLWMDLLRYGAIPCGLGARDSLRLEAGLSLYGQDMDENTNPFSAGVAWTLDKSNKRSFIGKEFANISQKMVTKGIVISSRSIARAGSKVITDVGDGVVTSGVFSPALSCSIAFARLPYNSQNICSVVIRDKPVDAKIVGRRFLEKRL